MDGLEDVNVRVFAIHRRVSRVNYSRRFAEASAVKAYQKQGLSLVPGMEIGYVVRGASEFDAEYYGKLLEKAWDEVTFVLQCDFHNSLPPQRGSLLVKMCWHPFPRINFVLLISIFMSFILVWFTS
jgi:hypothetical protein